LVDFVGADFDGFRVVYDFFAQFPSGFGDDVAGEEGVSGCADEDSVIVGYVLDVFAEQEAKLAARFLCGLLKVLESSFLAGVTKIIFFNKTRDSRHRYGSPAEKSA
jgi:hypothetical protein